MSKEDDKMEFTTLEKLVDTLKKLIVKHMPQESDDSGGAGGNKETEVFKEFCQVKIEPCENLLQEIKQQHDAEVSCSGSSGDKKNHITSKLLFTGSVALVLVLMIIAVIVAISKIGANNQVSCISVVSILLLAIVFIVTIWIRFQKKDLSLQEVKETQKLELQQSLCSELLEWDKLVMQFNKKKADQMLEIAYKRQMSKIEEHRLEQEHQKNIDNRMIDAVESYMKHLENIAMSNSSRKKN